MIVGTKRHATCARRRAIVARPVAALLDRQLIARATGQASRRGLILRQPSGEQLLADVEAWLLMEYPDAVRRTNLRPTGEDQAQLLVALHPAAPDLRMLAWDSGRVDVVAETRVVGQKRVWARRRGEFRDASGNLLAWVHTDWVMIDRRGALTRIPPIFGEIFGGLDATGQIGRVALPPMPAEARHDQFVVRPHELDPMAHANNAVYLDWLEEAIDDDRAEALPRRYRMEYAAAVAGGDTLRRAAWPIDGGWAVRLAVEGTGQEAFRAVVSTE